MVHGSKMPEKYISKDVAGLNFLNALSAIYTEKILPRIPSENHEDIRQSHEYL